MIGDQPHPEALPALILEISDHRDWTTLAGLARWFDMHRRSLSTPYIRVPVEPGAAGVVLSGEPQYSEAGLPDPASAAAIPAEGEPGQGRTRKPPTALGSTDIQLASRSRGDTAGELRTTGFTAHSLSSSTPTSRRSSRTLDLYTQ